MSKINDGGPAFPTTWDASHNAALQTEDGMSLRDWFAGQFLASVSPEDTLPISPSASQAEIDNAIKEYWSKVARAAYIAADAFIAARAEGRADA